MLCCLPSRTHLIQIKSDLCCLYAQINSKPADEGSCEMRIILPFSHSFAFSVHLHFNPANIYPCLILGRFIKINKAQSFCRTGAWECKSSDERSVSQHVFVQQALCSSCWDFWVPKYWIIVIDIGTSWQSNIFLLQIKRNRWCLQRFPQPLNHLPPETKMNAAQPPFSNPKLK